MIAAALRARFDEAEEVTGWALPDMSILAGGRGRSLPMPGDMFGSLWSLIGDLAEGSGAPIDYVAAGVITTAASLIGAKRRVQPFATAPEWRVPPALWFAVVGDPSTNKTPAISAATSPLRAMELELADDHRSRLAEYEARLERAKAEKAEWQGLVKTATKDGVSTPALPDAAEMPDAPERKRLLVQDATPESMGAILAGNPNGILHLRDELAGWLASFERYSPGGREFWLEAYNGLPHVIDRKSMGGKSLFIPFNGVSVLGGIQPQKLAETLLDTADDGLVQRFLWVWPEAIPYRRPRSVAEPGKLERVYRRLASLEAEGTDRIEPVTLMLTDDAGDIFEAWILENDAAIKEASGLYLGFLGKLRGVALRLALVSELLVWAAGDGAEPRTVSVRSITAALAFLDDYAKPTALRVFGDAALPPVERNAAALARYIRRHRPRSINARDIRRTSGIATLKRAPDVEEAIKALVEAEWLRLDASREGGTPGRARKDFLVNPAALDG
jgi:hypothetical protein